MALARRREVSRNSAAQHNDSSVAVGLGAITQRSKVELRQDADDDASEKVVTDAMNAVVAAAGGASSQEVLEIDRTPWGPTRGGYWPSSAPAASAMMCLPIEY